MVMSEFLQKSRTRIAAAKSRGVKFGRPPHKLPDNFEEQYWKWKCKEIKLDKTAKTCGVARTTFYEKARKCGENRGEKGCSERFSFPNH